MFAFANRITITLGYEKGLNRFFLEQVNQSKPIGDFFMVLSNNTELLKKSRKQALEALKKENDKQAELIVVYYKIKGVKLKRA